MQQKHNRIVLIFLLLLSILLASCATAPPTAVPTADLVTQADLALAVGNETRAVELLTLAAEQATSPEREHLLLRATSLYLYLDQIAKAEELLRQLPLALPSALQYHRELLEVRRLLQIDRPAAAYLTLSTLGAPPLHLRLESLRVQAEASAAVGLLLESAEARSKLDSELTDPEIRAENQQLLWNALSQTPMEVLRERMPPPPDAFGGWLELAFLVRSQRLDADRLQRAIEQWQQRYPDHAASETLVPELLSRTRDQLDRPRQLALLLPLSGPLAAAGQAIQHGFLAAYYADPNPPDLRIYDLGGEDHRVLAAYEEAVDNGADFVVGPLTKNSLAILRTRGNLPVPTLALNTLPEDATAPGGLFQFGLAPEDEARTAAQHALTRGYENALVLVPEGDWGERVAQAFDEAFSGEYQQVLQVAYYRAEASDFSQPIRGLLNLDASERRARQLRGVLQRSISFEPQRRQDVDVIFTGAFPREARLIRPLLRFHHAMDLPVLATSHVYTGSVNPAADRDMDGLRFVDMPWLLDPVADSDGLSRDALLRHWPGIERQPRLYALGIDAYRILPYLETMRAYPGDSIDGKTGVLLLDSDGRVHRKLLPGRFVQGRPRVERFAAPGIIGLDRL